MQIADLNGTTAVIKPAPAVDKKVEKALTRIVPAPVLPASESTFDANTQAVSSPPVTREACDAALKIILEVSAAQTLNKDAASVLKTLQPHFDTVAAYFAENRPDNEVQLTQGVWQQLWYINKDIRDRGIIDLREDRIYQYVIPGENRYINVSEARWRIFGIPLFNSTNFLVGNYNLVDLASPTNKGPKKNVIDLIFGESRSRLFKKLDSQKTIVQQVEEVEKKKVRSLKTPGPKGVPGKLWNIYIDDKVRICQGTGGRSPNNEPQYYVLVRAR